MTPFTSQSIEATETFAAELAADLQPGSCLALVGPLGAGKTAFVRGLARGLGVEDTRLVSSPTYVLVQEYPGRVPLFHLDLYRMVEPEDELIDLGLEEMLAEGVVAVEWADRAGDALPDNRLEIRLRPAGESIRVIEVRKS
jgi:tRNA threonylcarbamoyladenosine biosynthesis protein TsaE